MSKVNINEFKVGQSVRCIRASGLYQNSLKPDIEKGKVYVITRISGIGTIMLEGVSDKKWFNENRFETYLHYLDEDLFCV